MEEQDILDQMSGGHSGCNQETTTTDDHTVHLPTYLPYFSFGFTVISTVIIVVMAGWIIFTIKITRSLHKIHNIYVAHLMATDAIAVLISMLLSCTIAIGYHTGMGDFIGCHVFTFLLFPLNVINLAVLMIAVDKVIAIAFPLKYHQIMRPRFVFGIIIAQWSLAIVLNTHYLFHPKDFIKIAKFGACLPINGTVYVIWITYMLTVFLACFAAVILNIYLTIKAYQVHKQIQEESKLSGGHTEDNDQLKALKKKQIAIKKHRKPMVTLLVVVLGTSSFGLLFPLMFIPTIFLENPVAYEEFIYLVAGPITAFTSFLFHPFVYGLYFKQVREPMMRLLKRITFQCKCKSASVAVAPAPQRIRIA